MLSAFYILATAWTWNPSEVFWQGHWSIDDIGDTGIILWRIALIFILTRMFVAITPALEQGVGIAYFLPP